MAARSNVKPTAAQRTVSLFTGMTDLDAPNSRDGSGPDATAYRTLRARPRFQWIRFELRQYICDVACASIEVRNERPRAKDGRWLYLVSKRGREIATMLDMPSAADVAERDE